MFYVDTFLQARLKIARRNINNLRYADDTTLMAESEELKSFLMKEEREKVGLKLTFKKLSSWHPVHSEDQPWDFFGRNDAKAETPVLWPPRVKS